jgi:hypothetical protein
LEWIPRESHIHRYQDIWRCSAQSVMNWTTFVEASGLFANREKCGPMQDLLDLVAALLD